MFPVRFVTRFVLLCAVLDIVAARPVSADGSRSFPYEALVRTAEVEVRSGPGQRYYVTGRLRQNERVTVHRHDPGGWYMISPPSGSFSWIDADLVRPAGGTTGIIEVPQTIGAPAPRALVRIGSEFSDDHAYYGRELTTGDEVQILGEKTLITDRGAARMYKIAPPALEYRWVKGDFIVPAGEAASAPSGEVDPFAGNFPRSTPIANVQPAATPAAPRPAAAPTPQSRPAAQWSAAATAGIAPPNPLKEEMAQLDERFIRVTRTTPEHWDLDRLLTDYQSLRARADAPLAAQIDQRLTALGSRRQVWENYQEFLRLTTETSQRDAALAAQQTGGLGPAMFVSGATPRLIIGEDESLLSSSDTQAGGLMAPSGVTQTGGLMAPNGVTQAGGVMPDNGVTPAGWQTEAPTVPGAANSHPSTMAAPSFAPGPFLGPAPHTTPAAAAMPGPQAAPAPTGEPTAPSATPRLDGAGLITRIPTNRPGVSQFVLTDTQGRVLAVLQPMPGLNLDSHVGQPFGVIGARFHDPRSQVDVIQVRQLLPVQLAR